MNGSIIDFISLQKGEEDKLKVLDEVKENISFRNANLWILICAILIASIGLNVNSTAVIIGAMLISPLMGPIVGAGFALATYDFVLLRRAGKNLLIATIVSLFVAALFFFTSPFKESQSELLARTSPNIYDVLIAFLGGLVGVIALTRASKGNPIPGVAIATALMPPLCTAGYGIAIGNLHYFLGAFYLYFINCFFIFFATYFITKYLKYPAVSDINQKHEKLIHRLITALIIIIVVPSLLLAYKLYDQKQFDQRANEFIEKEFTQNGFTVLVRNFKYNRKPKEIEVAFLSGKISENERVRIEGRLKEYRIENTQLVIMQDSNDIKSQILKELKIEKKAELQKDIEIDNLKKQLNYYQLTSDNFSNEIKILFPEIIDYSIGRLTANSADQNSNLIMLYKLSDKSKPIDNAKLGKWLQQKFNSEEVTIINRDEVRK